MEPILVTGATGKTGNAVASELLRRGVPVRALVHSLDARSERFEREQHFPRPTRPCLAADSQRWHAEHVPVDGSPVASAVPVPPELRATPESQASAAWN